MKERPILFSSPMVRAILDWRKTQTLRAKGLEYINNNPQGWRVVARDGEWIFHADGYTHDPIRCPYGVPGDRLWVRETWRTPASLDGFNATEIAAKCVDAGWKTPWAPVRFEADKARANWGDFPNDPAGRARSSRFMPRWASRLTLEVVNVRVERLQEISPQDATAEGIEGLIAPGYSYDAGPVEDYGVLWDSINGKGAWNANPWVWVVEFKQIEQERKAA